MSIDRRILIADDDLDFRAGVVDLLASLQLEILEAGTGREALSILRQQSLHLALLDMHMPELTGLDVLRAVREETLLVPCIFWSGDATHEIELSAREAGAVAVLRKPVQPLTLRNEVMRRLGFELPPDRLSNN